MNLKPCPFCSSENIKIHNWEDCHIYCGECKATGPKEDTEEEAIKFWNERNRDKKEERNKPTFKEWCLLNKIELNETQHTLVSAMESDMKLMVAAFRNYGETQAIIIYIQYLKEVYNADILGVNY